jgi:type I restriction-modification system DNA methylase subunit
MAVSEILTNFQGLDALKQLLWSELNYERANTPLSRRGWPEGASQCLQEDPLLFAVAGMDDAFRVVYARLTSEQLLLGAERRVMSQLMRNHPYALFIFSNRERDHWHFVNAKYDDDASKRRMFRRITVGQGERLRTATERIAMLDLGTMGRDPSNLSPLEIQERHDEAFNVEKVTAQFFDEYKSIFIDLQKDLVYQVKDQTWAHDYALQFLNRLMFLCFVQRKRWLGANTEFLRLFWETYRESGESSNSFFEQWLKILFFEALNNRLSDNHNHFPDEIMQVLKNAPYLNGGLFVKNHLDSKYTFSITDESIEQVIDFLDRYNFTIAEDSPFDKEVAVDPEMIGKVYESLVNVSEEIDERGEAGIFYTERTEIDIMCRLSLVDYMANHLGEEHRNSLYEVVFALDPDEKTEADQHLTEANLWPQVASLLRDVTVIDPACGSGSFLVGMLNVLDDLTERADCYVGNRRSGFERKKQIIGQNLYGVDVMEWACHVAELRLWLSLIVDAEFTLEELLCLQEPLLPHFSFKIRCGDSLVQEIGGINLGRSRSTSVISPEVKARIADFKVQKLKFYNNDSSCSLSSVELIRSEEQDLFLGILNDREQVFSERADMLRRMIETPQARQMRIDGTVEPESRQMSLKILEWQQELEACKRGLVGIRRTLQALNSQQEEVPFVWDMAFVEVFEGDKNGFDIVIGNPPYVRQESISDPKLSRDKVTPENKRFYKQMLARSVYQVFPRYFGYRPGKGTAGRKLDKQSDLYIYFYFQGLSLLNPKGTLCFVTSNSWLDVQYGADLQEFLLRHCHVKMVLDNQIKRSFASADINTVIVLFSAPDEKRESDLKNIARFVQFRVPFEQILLSVPAVMFQEIEEAGASRVRPEYRVYPLSQKKLLEDGYAELRSKKATYRGGKWGGKYLRAPDIYWTIQDKGSDKLVKLQELAKVRRGLTTGANNFFYVRVLDVRDGIASILCDDGSKHTIEEEYVCEPVLVKAREIVRPHVSDNDLTHRLVNLDDSAAEKPHAAQYIRWGVSKDYHLRPSTSSRKLWYVVNPQESAHIAIPIGHKRRPVVAVLDSMLVSDNLVQVTCEDPTWINVIAGSVLSTWSMLVYEVSGRANFGQGLLKTQTYEIGELPVLDPRKLSVDDRLKFEACFDSISRRPFRIIYDEVGLSDRDAIDCAFLETIGVIDATQRRHMVEELQQAVCSMIWNRMAKSDKSRESRKTYAEWLATGRPFDSQVSEDDSDKL